MAALANPERRIAALYATSEAAQDMTRCIDALPEARRAELPAITERTPAPRCCASGDGR